MFRLKSLFSLPLLPTNLDSHNSVQGPGFGFGSGGAVLRKISERVQAETIDSWVSSVTEGLTILVTKTGAGSGRYHASAIDASSYDKEVFGYWWQNEDFHKKLTELGYKITDYNKAKTVPGRETYVITISW